MKIWFNKNFSSIHNFIEEMKKYDEDLVIYYTEPSKSETDDYSLEYPNTIEEYVSFAEDNNIDVFIPCHNIEMIIENKTMFNKTEVITPVSDLDLYNNIENKSKFYLLLSEFVPEIIPKFKSTSNKIDFLDFYKDIKNVSEEVCMKPSVSIYAAGFKKITEDNIDFDIFIKGKDRYTTTLRYLEEFLPDKFDELMVLEYLSGSEYSYDVYCENGHICWGVVREKHMHTDSYQTIVKHEKIEHYSKLIAEKFNLNGFNNFQFKNNSEGFPYILEINTRMSGGISKCNLSGINFAELFVKKLKQIPFEEDLKNQKENIKVFGKRLYYSK